MQEPQANKKTYWDIAHERKKDAEVYAGVEKDFHPGIKQEVKIFQMTSSPDILPITWQTSTKISVILVRELHNER